MPTRLQTDDDNDLKRLLRRITARGCPSIREIAEVLHRAERTVYAWTQPNVKANMPACDVADLSCWLISEYGDTRLANYCIPSGAVIVVPTSRHATNGSLSDEIVSVVALMGAMDTAWKARDYATVQRLAGDMVIEAARMNEEAAHKLE